MDPTACWNEMLAALQDEQFETAAERANDLENWLANSGFVPRDGDAKAIVCDVIAAIQNRWRS